MLRWHYLPVIAATERVDTEIRCAATLLLGIAKFRVGVYRLVLLLPVGDSGLQRQVCCRQVGGGRVCGWSLLLDGIGDGHIIGKSGVGVGHPRRVTRHAAIKNRWTDNVRFRLWR
jgi:hypothetical protein